ncbi:UDP-glucosyltransferase 2-like [Hyalella azteca]|uniref:UDP-glucosyltransferase 2-like n=1 Tax=Hyalella azteca TaxID=294128 RepID=A0A8B7PDS4_HYAAZ|nr:UDP-glucosyltransferase 2-like [Hyalella azteca]
MRSIDTLHLLVYSVLLFTVPKQVCSYKILMALLLESDSVHFFYTKIARHLVEANHSVTFLTFHDSSFTHPNFVNVNIMEGEPPFKGNAFDMVDLGAAFDAFYAEVARVGTRLWENQDNKKLFENRHEFDAIITSAGVNSIVLPYAINYTGPLILIQNAGVEYFATAFSGNWLPPSVVPSILMPYDEYMSFYERCMNLLDLWNYYHGLMKSWYECESSFLENYFPGIGDISRFYGQASLTLINGHHALDNPVPLLPNQVEIGTLNAHTPEPLPQDLEEFVASSGDHGVIYFSLGSFARSSDIPARAKMEFVEAFRRLPQKIIWKYEADDLDLPPNVLTRPWLPQQDILGHPKTRVFISHCGIMGAQEAKYHGVPVLAVPIAFDQHRNAARMVRQKVAISLSWNTVTADQIVDALNILVNDTSYSERLRRTSAVLQDQKESPADRAVWWVEYVIRHGGAPHLQYPGQRLHFLQYICADVLLFLAVCTYLVYRLAKCILLYFVNLCFGKVKPLKTKIN